MSFQFVDNSDINNKSRKLIRSHVMRGKNIGKVRIKKDKNPKPAANNNNSSSSSSNSNHNNSIIVHKLGSHPNSNGIPVADPESPHSKDAIISVTRQIVNDLSLLAPTKVAPQAMLHLQQMAFYVLDIGCPPVFCQQSGILGWMWFHLAFQDEAYFHCNIGIASACAAFLSENASHSPIALYHMSQAYHLLNRKLSSDEALSDATIAVVASINVYDRLYGDPLKAMVHHNAVTRMIALRGGITELAKRNFLIAEKTFRSDIELAIHCGSAPSFSSKDVPRHLILIADVSTDDDDDDDSSNNNDNSGPHNQQDAELRASALYQSVCAGLRAVVLDILRLSRVLNEASWARKLDPTTYQATLLYVGYRLLENKLPDNNDNDNGNDNYCCYDGPEIVVGAGVAGGGGSSRNNTSTSNSSSSSNSVSVRSSVSSRVSASILDTLVELAMIGFQSTFSFGIGRKVITFPLVVARFATAGKTVPLTLNLNLNSNLNPHTRSNTNRSRQLVILWALLIGRLSSLVSRSEPWFLAKLRALANALGLRAWVDVRAALCTLPWVAAMHDAPAREFWDSVVLAPTLGVVPAAAMEMEMEMEIAES